MATLRELFAKLYAYVLLFEQEDFQRAMPPSSEQVSDKIGALVETQKAEARRQDLNTDQEKGPFREALFAFIAWADETLVNHVTWEQRDRWKESPLQLEYFETHAAGDELFDEHLPYLEQKEVQEIYYLSLGLGFKGRYHRGRSEDERRLAHERHSLAQQLSVEDVQRLDKLTPQPYQVPPPDRLPPPPPPWTRLLLKVALVLLVAVPLGYWIYHWLIPEPTTVKLQVVLAGNGRGMVSSTPEGIRCAQSMPSCTQDFQKGKVVTLQATPEPGSVFAGWSGDSDCATREFTLRVATTCTATFTQEPPPPPLKKLVEDALAAAQLSCAAVDPKVQDSTVTLGGRVESKAQQAEIRRRVQSVPGVAQINDTLQIVPRPFCEIVELLEPFKKQNETPALGLTMHLNKGGTPPIYLRGDNLAVDGQTPKTFASHVYIDSYAADGKGVGHVLPNDQDSANVFAPNSPYSGGTGVLQWKTSSPFGLELLTVIATKMPLFEGLRPKVEAVDVYLPVLRQALQKVAPSDVAVTFFFLTTQDQ
jgi:type IV/VI secretion system ImpK/VasF family protein